MGLGATSGGRSFLEEGGVMEMESRVMPSKLAFLSKFFERLAAELAARTVLPSLFLSCTEELPVRPRDWGSA